MPLIAKPRLTKLSRRIRALGLACVLLSMACVVHGDEREQSDFFENNVRPLLLERCVKCHGPKKSESGLRLDTRAGALKGGDNGAAMVVGKPIDSLLLKAVRHDDFVSAMPPDEKLSAREIQVLERWIKRGAFWPEGVRLGGAGPQLRSGPITEAERAFWSFQPLADPTPPANVAGPSRNAIDQFVNARAGAARLPLAPAADKRTLIRRATFDLTGLPPTPAEMNAFLNDDSPQAFARVVDRLLASDAYGERWARHWLDVVRYADTAGETADYPTPLSYKYRNWVVRAFRADMPYDQFIRWQLAGDIFANELLGDADANSAGARSKEMLDQYRDMLTATGFIAISRRFGFDVENYHHLTIQDTIDTVGQAVLGLSLGCARCHDHKYDPVNTEDYYAWYGVFESTRYSFPGSEQKKRPYDLFPPLPPSFETKQKAEADAKLAAIDERIKQLQAESAKLEKQLATAKGFLATLDAQLLKIADNDRNQHMGFHVWRNEPLPVVGLNTSDKTLKVPGTVPPNALVAHPNPKDGVALAWRSPIRGRVRISGKLSDAHDCGDSVLWFIDRIGQDQQQTLAKGDVAKAGSQSFGVEGKPIEVDVAEGDFLQLAIMPKAHYGCDLTRIELRIQETTGEKRNWDPVADLADDLLESNPNDDRFGNKNVWYFLKTPADRNQLQPLTVGEKLSPEQAAKARTDLDTRKRQVTRLSAEKSALQKRDAEQRIYGAVEKDKPQDARIRIRGDRHDLGDIAPRRNLQLFGGERLAANAGSGRRELAAWLTRKETPLLARVMANRIWQHHFGHGIVSTENDFGVRGARPTHPLLLDWLAVRFRESGYSIKAMHRLIMNSAAYQRSSRYDQRAAEVDPDATLFWRFNRRRLSAEEIRDAMLHVSGDLDTSMGGAHPFPPVETWGFSQHAPFYGEYPSKRRSIYLMQQRLKRHPFLALFDGADTNVSTARRELTTAPTQALYLMNSEFVHEQADRLAARILAERDTNSQRLDYAWTLTLGRTPTNRERSDAKQFLKRYAAAVEAAPENQAVAETKSWAALARTLLTRNEFLFVD